MAASPKSPHGNLRWQLIRCNNIEDSSVLDDHSRRIDSVRCHYTSREKSFETHVPRLRDKCATEEYRNPTSTPKGPVTPRFFLANSQAERKANLG